MNWRSRRSRSSAHGIEDEFSEAALADARAAIAEFEKKDKKHGQDPYGDAAHATHGQDARATHGQDARATHGRDPYGQAAHATADPTREDFTHHTVVTIDPPDARDYDDAISLDAHDDGTFTLGVHIADVSHFVREGTALDDEARRRGTSTYFPKKVVPMLPEVLSNGVCSLQQGQDRFCLSAFMRYDAGGNITARRFARTVIRSAKRLTYLQAQDIIDGKTGGYDSHVVTLVRDMESLARRIESRRRGAGMLHLDLPEVQLVFDDGDRVIDARPEDDSYTHTIIEMFMVEANEAVAWLLSDLKRPFLRRIHPSPDHLGSKQLVDFVHACGHKIPPNLTRRDMQDLLDRVKGKPESFAVNLALLKTFEQAEYSPMAVGHFALASENYCHFTSPIRRYPDLTVHRLLTEYCRGTLASRPPEDVSALTRLGEHCTAAEKRSEGAEEELRDVLILQFLQTRLGDVFEGVITGVTNFGIFVQSMRFLIEGLVRMEDLGDDWWEVNARIGQVSGQRSGKRFRIGDLLAVRIANVDLARRQLNLVPERAKEKPGAKARPNLSPNPPRKTPPGEKARASARSSRARNGMGSEKRQYAQKLKEKGP